jgi:trimethylamine:corrinoid methyltransferase-like protein
LGTQEDDRIHAACLEILERVGIEVHDDKARELLVTAARRMASASAARTPRRLGAERRAAGMTLYDRNSKSPSRARL